MEEYSAITNAINEANSLAEKTAASQNTHSSGSGAGAGRGGGGGGSGSAGSKRVKTSVGTADRSARGPNRGGGDDDSRAETREGGGISAGSRRGSGYGGGAVQAGSVGIKSKASGGGARGGVKVAGAAGAASSSVGSKEAAASYTVARHVADFGNVVVGFTKTKAFRVANTGKLGPVSWSFNKNTLAGSGYSIEPEKVVRLPEGASAAFSASFQARQGLLCLYEFMAVFSLMVWFLEDNIISPTEQLSSYVMRGVAKSLFLVPESEGSLCWLGQKRSR